MTTQIPTTEAEWRVRLNPEEFRVLRQAGTEAPWTGEYVSTRTPGMYHCRACGAELFASDTKFDSHCGWPSFYDAVPGTVPYAAFRAVEWFEYDPDGTMLAELGGTYERDFAGYNQRITDLVHVDEVIHVIVAVGARPGVAQLAQRVGAQGAEGEETVRLEDTATFGERLIERLAPLQHQAAEHHIHAGVGQGQAQRVRAHPLEAPPPLLMPARLAQHPGSEVERKHERAPVAALELARDAAGAGTQVEHHARLEGKHGEPLEQLRGHARLQAGGGLIAGAGAIEGRPQPAAVEAKDLCRPRHAGTP